MIKLTRAELTILLGLLVLAFVSTFTSVIFNPAEADTNWWARFFQNFATEVLGTIVALFLFSRYLERNRKQEERQQAEQRRIIERNQRIFREIRSEDKTIILNALHEIKDLDLLKGNDGLLKNANLAGANLEGTNLSIANLQDAKLVGANLQNAKLVGANLQGAKLEQVNLHGADLMAAMLYCAKLEQVNLSRANLTGANLQGTKLVRANLQNAKLAGANLQGAKLEQVNLHGANLKNTEFNEQTNLPNNKKWTPETNMAQFTDPQHPNFWQPKWARAGFDSYSDWRNAGEPTED